jgi:hypothetical protein
MKKLLVATAFLALAAFLPARAALADDGTIAAREAATKWLELTDSGKYAESWDKAAAIFRSSISKKDWEAAAKKARGPLGTLKTRTVQSAVPAKSLPGVPDGDYVVLQFSTSFENKASAVETVTPMKEKDGSWRVSGYFIK